MLQIRRVQRVDENSALKFNPYTECIRSPRGVRSVVVSARLQNLCGHSQRQETIQTIHALPRHFYCHYNTMLLNNQPLPTFWVHPKPCMSLIQTWHAPFSACSDKMICPISYPSHFEEYTRRFLLHLSIYLSIYRSIYLTNYLTIFHLSVYVALCVYIDMYIYFSLFYLYIYICLCTRNVLIQPRPVWGAPSEAGPGAPERLLQVAARAHRPAAASPGPEPKMEALLWGFQ